MVTLEELKQKIKKETEDIKTLAEHTGTGEKSGLNANYALTQIVDIIFNKIIELMDKDTTMGTGKKWVVVSGARGLKEPIKDYIMKMNKEDTRDIVKKVKALLDLL